MNSPLIAEKPDEKEEFLLPPSKEQTSAIDFLIEKILDREPVVGFIAPGGCGKTFSLKHLVKDERLKSIPIVFTATTNKAASVMKAEKLKGAKSLHSAISIHIKTKMFVKIEEMFKLRRKNPKIEIKIPPDVENFLEEIGVKQDNLFDYKDEREMLAENKVDSYDERVFSHYATSEYIGGVCFIDEASMLPTKSQYQKDHGEDGKLKLKAIGLDIVKKIYDTVVLVGDDSQLPPINGDSSFDGIPKVTLTENHRSDKGLLRFLDYIRDGGAPANFEPVDGECVSIIVSAGEEYFIKDDLIKNKVTHIVFRNKTRIDITKIVRAGLSSEPVIDEPIVYKGANIDNPGDKICKNETGTFNGFMGIWGDHTQVVSGRHFDEYGEGFTYLQYAYAITAHCAQGSSFDYVVIHYDDVPHFIDKEKKRKWIYTACSRARKGIIVVY